MRSSRSERDVVGLVKLCGVSGAAQLLNMDPALVLAEYELTTGDVLPRVARNDEEVLDGCSKLMDWSHAAGATTAEFLAELGKAMRLPPKEVESLWRTIVRRQSGRSLDELERLSTRVLDDHG